MLSEGVILKQLFTPDSVKDRVSLDILYDAIILYEEVNFGHLFTCDGVKNRWAS